MKKDSFNPPLPKVKQRSNSAKYFDMFLDSIPLKVQSGDLCRHPFQSPDAVGQGDNHKFLTPEPKITRDAEESKQVESDRENGLEIIPHSLRLGGLRKEAVFENRHEKESPLSITSGLLSHGGNNL